MCELGLLYILSQSPHEYNVSPVWLMVCFSLHRATTLFLQILLSWAENAIFAYFSSACFIYSLLYTRYRTMYTPNDFFMSSYNNFSSTCNSRLMYKIFCKILDKCKNVQCINKCWCNGKCARFECGRSWIRAAIESNQRYMYLFCLLL
jgi:hypothetical protein